MLDVHHFDGPRERLLALWAQIAPHYAGADPGVSFELLNELHDPTTAEEWNALLAEALAVVRETNPRRTVIAGPVRWNIVDALPGLRLPDDEHLVATVHYHSPFRFTHQGAGWIDGAAAWLGTSWGSDAERARVRADLQRAAAWARAQGRRCSWASPGPSAPAAMDARARWTEQVRSEAERLGMSWAYRDFATDFGALDPGRNAWRAQYAHSSAGPRRGRGLLGAR